jgi:hypothetical protein
MGRPGLSLDRKFKRLARALDDVQAGFGEMLARGALELLWDSAYEACDDFVGDVDDVEAQAHWRGKRGTLVSSLLGAGGEGRCGFIEEGGTEWWPAGKHGTFRIHDLWDHAPEYAAKRAAREAEREVAGTTISEIRAAAGRKGRATQLGAKGATGGQTEALAEQVAGKREASGGQTDAGCGQTDAIKRANGVPPSPTPTPSPTPQQQQAAASEFPATRGLAEALDELGWHLTLPAYDKRKSFEAALTGNVEAVSDFVLADLEERTRRQQEIPGSLGFYLGDVSAIAKRAAVPPPPIPIVPVLDLAWLDQLPESQRAEARAEWTARAAEVEASFSPASIPRVLASLSEAVRQQFSQLPTGATP